MKHKPETGKYTQDNFEYKMMQNNKDCNKHGTVLDVTPKDFDKEWKASVNYIKTLGKIHK